MIWYRFEKNHIHLGVIRQLKLKKSKYSASISCIRSNINSIGCKTHTISSQCTLHFHRWQNNYNWTFVRSQNRTYAISYYYIWLLICLERLWSRLTAPGLKQKLDIKIKGIQRKRNKKDLLVSLDYGTKIIICLWCSVLEVSGSNPRSDQMFVFNNLQILIVKFGCLFANKNSIFISVAYCLVP